MKTTQTVHPQTGRRESAVVALAVLLVAFTTVGYASMRSAEPVAAPLLDWQVSAFSDLPPTDQAIHAALFSADGEIAWLHYRMSRWPDIADLEEDLLPPFYQDGFWSVNGSVQWRLGLPLNNDQGATYYHGSGGTVDGQSAYLLVVAHIHAGMAAANQTTIWIHPDPNASFPEVLRTDSLIRAGWRQVIPYSGASELERLRGGAA